VETQSISRPSQEGRKLQNYPVITSNHLASAQLFANRFDMIVALKERLPANPTVCEVGVALGDFSEFLLNTLRPKDFIGMDLFGLHELGELWGRPTREIFHGKTHAEFFQNRFSSQSVRVMEGDSVAALASLPDQSLDLIYIDGDHSYEGVKADTDQAIRKVKPDGLLIFNDYIMYDHLQNGAYGVVQAVNELVDETDWRIIGFALQHRMFCDIALQRTH
jgi:hypothetical protein